jgi:hypothetical protein
MAGQAGSPACTKSLSHSKVTSSRPVESETILLHWRGCHVETHVWATRHHSIGPHTFPHQHLTTQCLTRVMYGTLPHQPLPCVSTVTFAMCPIQKFHISSTSMPRQQYDHAMSVVRTCHVNTVRTLQSTKFFLFGKADITRYFTHMTPI